MQQGETWRQALQLHQSTVPSTPSHHTFHSFARSCTKWTSTGMPKRSLRSASSPARGLVLKTPSARARRPPGEPLEARASSSATSTRSCSWVRLFPHKAIRSVFTIQKVNKCFLSFLLFFQEKKKLFLFLFDHLFASCSGHPRVFQLFV